MHIKDDNPAILASALGDVAWVLQRNGLLRKGEIAAIPDKGGATIGRWEVTDGPNLSEAVDLMKDIYDHLDGGANLYPGSLIFEDDAPAIAVLGSFLRKAGALPALKAEGLDESVSDVAPAQHLLTATSNSE